MNLNVPHVNLNLNINLNINHVVLQLVAAAEEEEEHVEEHIDRSHHWLWPEGYEIGFFLPAFLIVFGLLYWKAWPLLKKAMADRTARIQADLDAAAEAEASAQAEAEQIRQAKGDIEAERARILADADARAEAVIADGRTRLESEVADLESKADADIRTAQSRSGDELRSEIARLAAAAADSVIAETLDDATRQRLIEDFIARVGSQSPVAAGTGVGR
jgi:F-type H+-transporting ATPase subunit b